jgi:hypothetical protein
MFQNHPATFIANIADQADANLVPLDRDTPCGVFETNGGNRYIIKKHDGGKVAIVLRHRFERPFTCKRLNRLLRAEGFWLGKAKVVPTRNINLLSGHLPIGTISSGDRVSSLLCRKTDGDCVWISLGVLFGIPFHSYDHWQIVDHSRILFEQGPALAMAR